MYIVRSRDGSVYMTLEPILHPGNEEEKQFPVGFAWTEEKGDAVRFSSRWHAKAVARARKGCVAVRVKS